MTWLLLGLGPLIFIAAMGIDYSHARMVQAVMDKRRHAAARWSVAQWGAATVGFVLAIKVTMWLLPFEACGLYCGMVLGVGYHSPDA